MRKIGVDHNTLLRDELEEYFKLPHEDFDLCKPLEWLVGRAASSIPKPLLPCKGHIFDSWYVRLFTLYVIWYAYATLC